MHPDNTVVCQVRTSRVSKSLSLDSEESEGAEEGAATAEENTAEEANS